MKKNVSIKWYRLFAAVAISALLFGIGLWRLDIAFDVVGSLPQDDPVIADAVHIFQHHPVKDQIFIDVGLSSPDPEALVRRAGQIEKALLDSGLFQSVGIGNMQTLFPELVFHCVRHLPALFSERELRRQVAPLLSPEKIHEQFAELQSRLLRLEGVGQARFIAADPLELKNLVMARMAGLVPTTDVQFYKNRLLSKDGRHLLIAAKPAGSGTDTAFARKLTALMESVADTISAECGPDDPCPVITPVGAYRAALDNEKIIRHDVQQAISLATLGIALLLLFAFPRPLIGLMSLLPAVAGATAALFVYSLFFRTISIMVLGFGGAIVSISVDHGIAYLLFVDRPSRTRGKEASREIWAIGLVAALTTVGAFGALFLTGFPLFRELGFFTALGIGFSFLFVHTVFPLIFPSMPPAVDRRLPLRRLVDRFCSTGKTGAVLAAVFCGIMLWFARPEFNVDIHKMNTVSPMTLAAEKKMASVWGDFLDNRKRYLMISADTPGGLAAKGDRLLALLEPDMRDGAVAGGFTPSMVFPGPERQKQNYEAWQAFWTPARVTALKNAFARSAPAFGFAENAFSSFFDIISGGYQIEPFAMPPEFHEIMGVFKTAETDKWVQFSGVTISDADRPAAFYKRYAGVARIFDPAYFSKRLGALLFDTFLKMFLVIGFGVAVMLFLLFVDFYLTAIALIPVCFALTCTLGTLHLMGRSLDIPGLMLSIVVLGMGVDYSLFYVRTYQRYQNEADEAFGLIRTAVFMAAMSTLIGFGVLCLAEHSLLRSAGFISLFGIGYSLIGTFVLLPPILRYRFRDTGPVDALLPDYPAVVRHRYRHMEAYPRLFARFKMMTDPMFPELSTFLKHSANGNVRTILDIGVGYGVPAAWCLAHFPNAVVYGIEPDVERCRVAARALGSRGRIENGAAPDVPSVNGPVDLALMLDMSHYLDDAAFRCVLGRIREHLNREGRLIMRAVIPPEKRMPLLWWIEHIRLGLMRIPVYYRDVETLRKIMSQAHLRIEYEGHSGDNTGLYWFVLLI